MTTSTRQDAGRSKAAIESYAARSGRPVGALIGSPGEDQADVVHELLTTAQVEQLDLVVSTQGGSVETARKLATVLRETLKGFRVLIADHARSAGTLLCLAADEIVLGPLAELGPVDPHASAARGSPGPGAVSSEDVRRFPEMAREWFGVRRQEDALQALALVAQRASATTLTRLYRFDQLVRATARELLAYQLPDAPREQVDAIAERLVRMGSSHDHPLMRAEAAALGLRIARLPSADERALWDLVRELRDSLDLTGGAGSECALALAAVGGDVRLSA